MIIKLKKKGGNEHVLTHVNNLMLEEEAGEVRLFKSDGNYVVLEHTLKQIFLIISRRPEEEIILLP